MTRAIPKKRTTLRQRILGSVGALIILSLVGSTVSLYRITEVNHLLDEINRVSVPLGRLFAQMQSDAEMFRQELDRSLGYSHWSDPHWRPRQIPRWMEEILDSEMEKLQSLVQADHRWTDDDSRAKWQAWSTRTAQDLAQLESQAAKLYLALEQKDQTASAQIYPQWNATVEEWRRELQWGASEYERSFRQNFSLAESRVSQLRTGLEMILVVVVSLSLLLLWLGERALRPLAELTKLAREITRRGLRREDKALLPEIPITRTDEVSALAREFHNMATALLEREKTVQAQKDRLQEQNRLLRDMGRLNENILHSIESVLIVTDLKGKITQINPEAARWLRGPADQAQAFIGTDLLQWPRIRSLLGAFPRSEDWLKWIQETKEAWRIEPCAPDSPESGDGQIYGGHLLPLRQESGEADGAILVLHNLTEEISLQERLRRAENLAAVGRLSAQVAHEVRNPLHSIGLEAEMAAELASQLGSPPLKQSLQSILFAVDRLEKITENYLKLSRLSTGVKTLVDLGEILESVLATYTPACEAQGVRVDWKRETPSDLRILGDRDLIEQVLGNLLRNSLQALADFGGGKGHPAPRVAWRLGNAESGRVWLRIEDNGPGVRPEVREKLFTPFVTTRAQGTGLGLSFVKKVLEDHDGTIVYRDRSPEGGACFEVTLPPAPAEKALGSEAALEKAEFI